MNPKEKAIESGILYNKLVELKITAPDIILEICKAKNKELDIALKEQVKEILNDVEANLVLSFEGSLQSKNKAEVEIHRKITDYNREKFNQLKKKFIDRR